MFNRKYFFWKPWSCLVVLLLLPLFLAACELPKQPSDYRAAHPIIVGKETVSMSMRVPLADAGLLGEDALSFERFVRDYLDRGRKLMTIKAGSGGESQAGAEQVRDLLVTGGIEAREIVIAPAGFNGDTVLLSFAAYKADVPECGKWSTDSTFNWSNKPNVNYGCSTQRNLGLMVQDPGDLERAKTVSDSSGDRGGKVITNYVNGPKASGEGGDTSSAITTAK
ncbi:MAG: CpaD family pilus assembly protein [Rhodospirillales bacterium]|nr:CpaD family pilus assembly protein [Rhodospirillales bacterium]